jgi:hypothetical protein
MRAINIIEEELKDLDSLVHDIKEQLSLAPKDILLLASLEQYEFRRSEISTELSHALIANNCHIVDIAIKTEKSPTFVDLAKILAGFQNAINGAKNFLPNAKTTQLCFASTFYGSFGIKAKTDSDDRFLLGDYYRNLDMFFNIDEDLNDDKNKYKLENNKTGLRTLANFYNKISEIDDPIEVKWISPSTGERITTFSKDSAKQKRNRLLKLDIAETNREIYNGEIKEINLLSNTFILVARKGQKKEKPTISFDSTQKDELKSLLDSMVTIEIEHSRSYDYEEEMVVEKKVLIQIKK